MSILRGLGWQIHDHLKEYRPKQFRELQEKGQLFPYVKRLEEQARRELIELEDGGLFPWEAWEIVRESVLLPSKSKNT